jgi:hypothetical protein
MSDKRPDPGEAFRNLITEWERGFDAMANKLMGTEEFSRSMNQLQDLQLRMQKRFYENMAEQLSHFNLPSREDVLRLGENILALDKRLARLEKNLKKLSKKKIKDKEKVKNKPGRSDGPPRTKLPPSARQAAPAGVKPEGTNG